MGNVPPVESEQLSQFFEQNLLVILVVLAVLGALYILAPRIVPPVVARGLEARVGEFEEGGVAAIELEKRARTIEGLTLTLIRVTLALLIGFVIIGLLGWWGVVTGVVLFLAALTLAGQSIVLDYLMGIFIVVEGTYFAGDTIVVGDPAWNVTGTVEEVGLRRTVIRAPDGTVHSISNALLRQVSNRTRMYAGADVTVRGIPDEDLGRVTAIMDEVGQAVAESPEHGASVIEAPRFAFLDDPGDLGWSATMRGKVLAGQRWAIATEIRRRLNERLVVEGIELNRRVPVGNRSRSGGADHHVVDLSASDDE